jgi:TolB-like protein/Tfp pilus assembly protein PilF
MSGSPNRLSKFWQELKRRNVVRVITVYAGAAFVILELVSMSEEPFGLPDWTFGLVVILLSIGFFIAVILSWIYDIHPKEGIIKTEQAEDVKKEDIPKSSNSWKIASYISFAVIVGLIVLNIIPRIGKNGKLEKSIAVLPFDNMSRGEEYAHLGPAIADEIILELQKIKAFDRVISRSSTMQYTDIRPTVPEMAVELGVNFIIEGSIQRREDMVSIRVQVIRAKNEDHIWGEEYEREWKYINIIQDDIAKHVAQELRVVMTSGEKERIEKFPTNNPEAYNQYLLGKFHLYKRTQKEVEKGIQYFHHAIQLDPRFALAYVYLAKSYQLIVRQGWAHPEEFHQEAMDAIHKAIELDGSLGLAYAELGLVMIVFERDFYGPEEQFQKAIQLSPNNAEVYTLYSNYLRYSGQYEEGMRIARKKAELDPLSPYSRYEIGALHYWAGRYDESIEELLRIIKTDSSSLGSLGLNTFLAYAYTMKGSYTEAVHYAERLVLLVGGLSNNPLEAAAVGWVYGKAGKRSEAEKILDMLHESFQSGQADPLYLAMVYAGMGDTDHAMEYIQKSYERRSGALLYLNVMSNTFFQNLRSNPDFMQILEGCGFKVNM